MEKRVYRFRDFQLEPDERRLSEAGKPIALTPKVFDTLVLLVERAGHVVSKDELMRLLWPRGYVDESNLTKHIWLIRRALGEGEQDSRFIETVPKLGYRFVAPVTTVGDAPAAISEEAASATPLPAVPQAAVTETPPAIDSPSDRPKTAPRPSMAAGARPLGAARRRDRLATEYAARPRAGEPPRRPHRCVRRIQ